ncbi:MAG: alpha-2-macroglobulin, partial [Flavobacteriaceae bacterium]|nr:alpha-2-macroglobulin [Flavobacteriaceae bacterium]
MKHYFLLLMIVFFSNISEAQTNDYSKLWKQVEELELEGLPKSALEIVEQISEIAEKNNNNNQIIKSLIYKSKFALILEEDAQLKVINDFKTEIANSEFPTTNILESLLANLYWQYFQQNRYKFYNRTKTEDKNDDIDFRTWDLQTLFTEIHLHFDNSLKSGLMLQQENLSKYNSLLLVSKDSKTYRPTLFDFLSHTALDFYKTDENSIAVPAFKFEIDNPDLLKDAEVFSRVSISTQDSESLQLKTLKIYQNLVAFHLNNNNPLALVDVDIKRLNYIFQKAIFEDKETALLETLKKSKNKYPNHEVSGLYVFEIATILYNKSLSFNTNTNQASKWKAKEALELCDVVIEKFPKSQAAIKCRNLKQRIYEETLSIRTESYIPNQKYSKVLVTYKNISILNFKIYSISNKNIEKLNNVWDEEEQLKIIKSLTELKNWQERLKNENDYQQHSIEVKIPKLENNRYLIYAENHNKTFAFSFLNVTDFALVEKSMQSKIIYQVINRNNGKPIENATVKVSYKNNYRSKVHSFTKTTNVNGEIAFQKSNKRKTSINVQVSKDGEKAHFGEFYVNRIYSENKDKKEITYNSFLFTDRSIYRPGQTVYFKGIVITTENKKSKVAEGETVFATLYDANNQKLTEMDFETNEFGSFHGELLLPNSGLNGQYRIETFITGVSKKSTYISVEEYKRPKFEAKFKPVTETYKIDDSITVKGNAIAFAGSSITDAKVVYRVERKIEFPRWFYWHRPSYFSEQQEITHGETTTDASGNFEITFKALADKSIDKNNLPIFKYVVTADVTDVNGETRSASTIVNIGYHALIATINIDGKIDKSNKENRLTIDTKNLNGELVPATGTVKIYKLKAPETVLRSRPWSAPEYKAFSKEEYNTLFPHEAYHNEDKSKNWEKGKLVFEKEFDSEKSKTIDLKNIKKWESGQYRIELESKDKFGQNVKDIAET